MTTPTRVLIVDDDEAVRATLAMAMEEEAWQVESVASAEDAFNRLAQARFDLVFCDNNLPGLKGVDLVRMLRDRDLQTAVMMITGHPTVASARAMLELGADGYIEKPFEDLYAVVRRSAAVVKARAGRAPGESLSKAGEHFRKVSEHLRGTAVQADKTLLTVLVVSPNAADREWMQAQFGPHTRVVEAGSVAQAIQRAVQHPPQLVILDDEVPPGLIEGIRSLQRHAPAATYVVLSGAKMSLLVLSALIDLSVRLIIDKPLDASEFRSKLEAASRRWRSPLSLSSPPAPGALKEAAGQSAKRIGRSTP